MAGRVLTISQYLGGADNIMNLNWTSFNSETFTYPMGPDAASYTYTARMQSILIDEIQYNREDGEPNYTTSTVIGSFDNLVNYTQADTDVIDISDVANGIVKITIPPDRYSGPMLINAKTNVVATVFAVQWSDGDDFQRHHRFVILERYGPGSEVGDPRLSTDPQYTAALVE